MLTKEECELALADYDFFKDYMEEIGVLENYSLNYKDDEQWEIIRKLINEHFDNPPLKFEELKPKMWVWDSERKCFLKITRVEVDEWYRHFVHHYYDINMNGTTRTLFKENRFYRKQVEE